SGRWVPAAGAVGRSPRRRAVRQRRRRREARGGIRARARETRRMIPDVSAIVVTHRGPPEAARCGESLRRAFDEEEGRGAVILVDGGSGAEEADELRAIPADRRLLLPENRGYSGGVNAGLAAARAGRLLLSNADVVFLPGALRPLLRAIDAPRAG